MVEKLYTIIKDYRNHDNQSVTIDHLKTWIEQFDEADRSFIIDELAFVFKKTFFSKKRIQKIFIKGFNDIAKSNGYPSTIEYLKNCELLKLQPDGKSQPEMLRIIQDGLNENYAIQDNIYGSNSTKHKIYIDDVLCTGNTFHSNISDWVNSGDDILSQLKESSIDLTTIHLIVSEVHLKKKNGQFYYTFKEGFNKLYNSLAIFRLENDLLKPVEVDSSEIIKNYCAEVSDQASAYAEKNGYNPYSENFYRQIKEKEILFSSSENRSRLEQIFLTKGIEILNDSNVQKSNIRPLGYSLPSHKDCGFGLIGFTWRNIPNNTPLVFWYKSPNFTPLFTNKRIVPMFG